MSTSSVTGRGPVKALVVVTYLAMVTMNFLANALPLNGRGTGEVSDAYPSLFTPAGLTFSIWGVIYLLLGLHVLYQLGLFRGRSRAADDRAAQPGRGAVLGLVAGQHRMGVRLALRRHLVVGGADRDDPGLPDPDRRHPAGGASDDAQRWLVGVPFSVYFGWTTVATVANITVLLVSLKWDGFGLSDSAWADGHRPGRDGDRHGDNAVQP